MAMRKRAKRLARLASFGSAGQSATRKKVCFRMQRNRKSKPKLKLQFKPIQWAGAPSKPINNRLFWSAVSWLVSELGKLVETWPLISINYASRQRRSAACGASCPSPVASGHSSFAIGCATSVRLYNGRLTSKLDLCAPPGSKIKSCR